MSHTMSELKQKFNELGSTCYLTNGLRCCQSLLVMPSCPTGQLV